MEPLSKEKVSEIKEMVKELDLSMINHSLIQDNKIIFTYTDKVYRCRMPNQQEQTIAETIKNKLRIKLIQEDDTKTKKQLINLLKEKQDINIAEMEQEKTKLKQRLYDTYLKLVSIPSDRVDEIEDLKIEINDLDQQFLQITYEISDHLSPCIEEQIQAEYYRYLSFACSEEQIAEDKFKPIWDTFNSFDSDDTGLSYKCIEYLHTLLLHIKE